MDIIKVMEMKIIKDLFFVYNYLQLNENENKTQDILLIYIKYLELFQMMEDVEGEISLLQKFITPIFAPIEN